MFDRPGIEPGYVLFVLSIHYAVSLQNNDAVQGWGIGNPRRDE